MFNELPIMVKQRMEYLVNMQETDSDEKVPREKKLRSITKDTGEFLALMLCNSLKGNAIEIGTSGGYSTLWLSLGCIETGKKLYTFEKNEEKIKLARETLNFAGVEDIVNIVSGDAMTTLRDFNEISFCFIDADKPLYSDLYELVIPRMVKGGILIADNVISHSEKLSEFCKMVLNDPRVDSMILNVGQGELFCRVK